MAPRTCPACGRPQGTNADCLSCRDAAAKELAAEARDITPEGVGPLVDAAGRFVARPPWWARGAPGGLGPVGWTDDLLVVGLALGLVKRELRDYCAWKGLSPAHFGL